MTGIERAIERQKKLEELSKADHQRSLLDVNAGSRFEFEDRYIDIIPDESRETVSIYFYRNDKNTAAVAMTLRAAIVLAINLPKILDEQFSEQIEELKKKLEEANR